MQMLAQGQSSSAKRGALTADVSSGLIFLKKQKSNFKLGGVLHKIEKLMCYKTMEQMGKKGLSRHILHSVALTVRTVTYRIKFLTPQISHLSDGANTCINHMKSYNFVDQKWSNISNFRLFNLTYPWRRYTVINLTFLPILVYILISVPIKIQHKVILKSMKSQEKTFLNKNSKGHYLYPTRNHYKITIITKE